MPEIVYSTILCMPRKTLLHANIHEEFQHLLMHFYTVVACSSNNFGVYFKQSVETVMYKLQMAAALGIWVEPVCTIQYYLKFCSITHSDISHFLITMFCKQAFLFYFPTWKGFLFPTQMKQKLLNLAWQSCFTKIPRSI